MNTCTATLPTAIVLHRPFWQRWWQQVLDSLARVQRRWHAHGPLAERELGLQEAMALNDHTLRDIGAPEWLREQASQQRELDSIALRAARLDLGGGGVRWFG